MPRTITMLDLTLTAVTAAENFHTLMLIVDRQKDEQTDGNLNLLEAGVTKMIKKVYIFGLILHSIRMPFDTF